VLDLCTGWTDRAHTKPWTPETLALSFSTTKGVASTVVHRLAERGELAYDEPVATYWPEFAAGGKGRVTVRDLLTHRVGFGDPEYLWRSSGLDFPAIVPRLRFVPPTTSFRSRFQYNNVTYALAGDVAAYASRKSWQELMRTWIYGPLGMTESYADSRELVAAGVTDVVSPHGIIRDTVRVLPVPLNVIDGIPAAGSAFSTATDMGKWLRFLLDSGRVSGGGRRLVSAQNFAELFKPQQILARPFFPNATLLKPHFQAYGLGWLLQDYRGEFMALHTGSVEGRAAIIGLLPDRRVGVVVLTNLDRSELRHALMYTVFDRYIGPQRPAHNWSVELRAMYKR
ncbi:MAG: serine hydrolase domain-containing protein, partial [Burkholderiales bacterium]